MKYLEFRSGSGNLLEEGSHVEADYLLRALGGMEQPASLPDRGML